MLMMAMMLVSQTGMIVMAIVMVPLRNGHTGSMLMVMAMVPVILQFSVMQP